MAFGPYSLLPQSRRSSASSTAPSSSRRSSYTGGVDGPRRSFSQLSICSGFACALLYFSFQSWTDLALDLPPPVPSGEDFARLYRTFTPERVRAPQDGIVETPMYSDECLESWLADGRPCRELERATEVELDAVISWVNGSDPLWHEQYSYYSSVSNIPKGWGPAPIRHYREKDELRHSLRALKQNMGGRLRKLHIILGDWANEVRSWDDIEAEASGVEAESRIGQTPAWLNKEVLGVTSEEGLTVEVHHHSELFLDRTVEEGDETGRTRYEERALPTFNSFAIESQLPNIPGLAPHWLYLNDDFFVNEPHSQSDWYLPSHGPLLRLEAPDGPFGQVDYKTEFPPAACTHERSALLRSNWLMAKRFGSRKRVPLSHIPKVQSQALLQESATIWAADFSLSSGRRFREIEEGETDESKIGDIHAVWLGALLLVERSRETMLWTWIVAKMGGIHGIWGDAERQELASLLDLDPFKSSSSHKSVKVCSFDAEERPTLAPSTLKSDLGELGITHPKASNITFSSLDGPEPGRGNSNTDCKLDMHVCFSDFWTAGLTSSANDIFKRIAFEHPKCGDCLLSSLVRASGPRGLSTLLPPLLPSSEDSHPPKDIPHMPLTKTWQETDFSLASIVPDSQTVDLRVWCLRLLARYQYSLGEQTHLFAQVNFPEDIYAIGDKLERTPVSTVVLNDDLDGTVHQQHMATDNIRSWLDQTWPHPAWWEREFVEEPL